MSVSVSNGFMPVPRIDLTRGAHTSPNDHIFSPKSATSLRITSSHRIIIDSDASAQTVTTILTIVATSFGGNLASEAGPLIVGTLVRLAVPWTGFRDARILWVGQGRAGCCLVKALTDPELEKIHQRQFGDGKASPRAPFHPGIGLII